MKYSTDRQSRTNPWGLPRAINQYPSASANHCYRRFVCRARPLAYDINFVLLRNHTFILSQNLSLIPQLLSKKWSR